MRTIARALVCLLLCIPAAAASTPVDLPESLTDGVYPIDTVIQSFTDGWIDWSVGTVNAWGRTPAKETGDMSNTPALREMAATRNARERMREILGNLRIGSEALISEDPAALRSVESLVENAGVAQKRERGRYLEVRLSIPILGPVGLVRALRGGDDSGADVRASAAADDDPTGVVIDARGTGLTPALLPRILDAASGTVWSAESSDPFTLMMRGIACYARMRRVVPPGPSRMEILKNPALARTGTRPAYLRAVAAAGPAAADLVLDEESSSSLQRSEALRRLLASARLVIVID